MAHSICYKRCHLVSQMHCAQLYTSAQDYKIHLPLSRMLYTVSPQKISANVLVQQLLTNGEIDAN